MSPFPQALFLCDFFSLKPHLITARAINRKPNAGVSLFLATENKDLSKRARAPYKLISCYSLKGPYGSAQATHSFSDEETEM